MSDIGESRQRHITGHLYAPAMANPVASDAAVTPSENALSSSELEMEQVTTAFSRAYRVRHPPAAQRPTKRSRVIAAEQLFTFV